MTYIVKEVFATLQGEGYNAGTPAVFVRFAGCNMWSGHDEHRARDAARNSAACPLWCDTDFRAGARMDIDRVIDEIMVAASVMLGTSPPMIVFTGGEPLLQLDRALVDELRMAMPSTQLAVETNGTALAKVDLDWICVSPKVAPQVMKLVHGDEIKIVYPAYDPDVYTSIAAGFTHKFVQAEAITSHVGASVLAADNMRRAAAWVMGHPGWRLSVQTHKVIGLP